MDSARFRVRRATLDDLDVLKALWESMRLPVDDLERRLTEFQVAETAGGTVVGALGFAMFQKQGLLHGESYSDYSVADEIRPLFWKRIQTLTLNHGVARLWTQESSAYWSRSGFQSASADLLEKLPAAWTTVEAPWLTMQLKDEEAMISMEKELAMLMEAERSRTAHAMDRAKTLKTFVTVIGLLVAFVAIGLAIYVYMHRTMLQMQGH